MRQSAAATCSSEGHVAEATIARGLRGPMLRVDFMMTVGELLHEEPWRVRGHNARTLVKHPDLRVVLVAMRQGSRLHEHRTAARLTTRRRFCRRRALAYQMRSSLRQMEMTR